MNISNFHLQHMQSALAEARLAASKGEVPIGAIIVQNEQVIARAHNLRETTKNPLHHAEILSLEAAAKHLGNWRLEDSIIYVTLEPCPMCLGALLQARVGTLVYGCDDDKLTNESRKSQVSGNNHTIQIIRGIMKEECSQVLKDFFKARREEKKTMPAGCCGFPNDF